MDAGQVALFAVIASVVGPLLLAALTNRNRRRERQDDWARQDAVADQAAEAARLLLASNAAVRRISEREFGTTQAQLAQIHSLVNHELGEAQRRERDATLAMLVSMREVIALKEARGIDPSPETLAAMAEIQLRVEVLTRSLERRTRMTQLINEQKVEDDGNIPGGPA